MTMTIEDCRFDGSRELRMAKAPTSAYVDKDDRGAYEELVDRNRVWMGELQDRLYADGREGLVILIQAMDAAGKDSTIKHVMSGMNPQGIDVRSFKQPTGEELAHGFLWRASRALPERGKIALLNRSYYEDVLVVRVHGLWRGYKMPRRCLNDSEDKFFNKRYREIREFEEYLYDNGYRVVKIFLNVSREEQGKRFLERLEDESKNYKFSASDLAERKLWPQYMDAYERAINATATEHAPWYVIPADQKWFTRYLVSEAVLEVLRVIDPHYPEFPKEERARLASYRDQLLGECGRAAGDDGEGE